MPLHRTTHSSLAVLNGRRRGLLDQAFELKSGHPRLLTATLSTGNDAIVQKVRHSSADAGPGTTRGKGDEMFWGRDYI